MKKRLLYFLAAMALLGLGIVLGKSGHSTLGPTFALAAVVPAGLSLRKQ